MIEKNGLIIVDNVLWHGEVADIKNQAKLTGIIREFNSYINEDKRKIKLQGFGKWSDFKIDEI